MTQKERHNLDATLTHIRTVQQHLSRFATALMERMREHDASKLEDPEFAEFAEVLPKLKGTTYGSDEYEALLEELRGTLGHHYAKNRHHPEHHHFGIGGMTLVDVVEMFCDWLAAVERHDDGDIMDSITKNKERFKMSPQLVRIFRNTAHEMQMGA